VHAIAIDAKAVYWVQTDQAKNVPDGVGSSLLRVARSGGAPQRLWNGPPSWHLTLWGSRQLIMPLWVDPDTGGYPGVHNLYLVGGRGAPLRVNKEGIGNDCMFNFIVADAANVFWTHCFHDDRGFEVLRRARSAASEKVILTNMVTFSGIALGSKYVLVGQRAGTDTQDVMRVPRSGGAPTMVEEGVAAFGARGDTLFLGLTDGTIVRRGITGPEREVLGVIPSPWKLDWLSSMKAVDERVVYAWASRGARSTIFRAEEGKVEAVTAAAGDFPLFDARPDGLAFVDGRSIRVVDEAGAACPPAAPEPP
jgi:hypothetical protein